MTISKMSGKVVARDVPGEQIEAVVTALPVGTYRIECEGLDDWIVTVGRGGCLTYAD